MTREKRRENMTEEKLDQIISDLEEIKKARRKSLSRRALRCRGDRRCTFPNDIYRTRVLWLFLPRPIDFDANLFRSMGSAS